MEVFELGEVATSHHEAAARLELAAITHDAEVRAGLMARARAQRRLGDDASAAAEQLRGQRYET